jgi:hypothetical protein
MKKNVVFLIVVFAYAGCGEEGKSLDDVKKDYIVSFDTVDTVMNEDSPEGLMDGEVLCQTQCTDEWKKECSGKGYHVCQDLDDNGCFEWSDVIGCPAGTVCKLGECVSSCSDQECTAIGAHKCSDSTTVVECGDYNNDKCLEWGNPVPCTENLVCSQGSCDVSCSSACTIIAAHKCEGNKVVTCGDYNNDTCLEWGDPQDCGTLKCSNGNCKETCENECTEVLSQTCEGNGYKICKDYNNDGCLEWGTVINCGKDQTCSNNMCKDKCENSCTAIGAKKCELNAVVKCDDYNDDGCLEWGTPLQCDKNLVCNNGVCESQCKSECFTAKSKKCDESGNVVICDDYNNDGCLKCGTPTPCATPYVCKEGYCALECSDECPVKKEQQCVTSSTNKYQICDEYDSDGCLEWGSPLDCDPGLVCSGKNCATACSNDCQVKNSKKCEMNAVRICGDYNDDGCLEWGDPVYCKNYEQCNLGECLQKMPPAKVVINEVLYDSEGIDTDTFVELFGPPNLDLTGFFIVGLKGDDASEYNSIQLSGKTGSDGFFVTVHPDAASWIADQADLKDENVDYQNGPDNIQLKYGNIVADAVGYGVFGSNEHFEGEGNPAPDVPAGHSIGRNESGTDTNNNATDFINYATPTPGAKNAIINQKPAAKLLCPTSGNTGDDLQFDGSQSTDPDGTITNYEFDFGDGSIKISGTANKVSHKFEKADTFTVKLTVTDDGSLSSSATCNITIGDLNTPAVVIIKPYNNKQVTQDEDVLVLVDATPAPSRTISKVEILADGIVSGNSDTSAPYEFTYTVPSSQPNNSVISLQAKAVDNLGSTGFSSIVHLNVKNDAPVASFTAVVIGTLKVRLDASASSDTETPVSDLEVRWDFDND